MRKWIWGATVLSLCCGVGSANAEEPTSVAPEAAVFASSATGTVSFTSVEPSAGRELVAEFERLCAAAKLAYSPKYAKSAAEARNDAIEKFAAFKAYLRSNPRDAGARGFAEGIRYQGACRRFAEPTFDWSAFATDALRFVDANEERRAKIWSAPAIADLTKALRAVVEAGSIDAESLDEDARRLADAERDYFAEHCDRLAALFGEFLRENDASVLEEMAFSLGELKFYQPASPAVAKLDAKAREYFCADNFQVEISEALLAAATRREIEERVDVGEYIRGSYVRGSGVVRGETSIDLRPNCRQAEIRLTLDADVTTNSVGTKSVVDVYSNNVGKVWASKGIFWSDEGLQTLPSVAQGSMKARVDNVDARIPLLLGGKVVNNKVAQEIPATELESARRMSYRVASRLDDEANRVLVDFNDRWQKARRSVGENDRLLRETKSRTDEDRLYFSCLVGRCAQWASPCAKIADLARSNAALFSEKEPLPEPRLSNVAPSVSERTQIGARLHRAFSPVSFANAGSNPGKQIGSLRRPTAAAPAPASKYAVEMRAHQSAPNNAAFVALAGLTLGEDGMFDELVSRFPGVDRKVAGDFLGRYRGKERDASANAEKISFQFDETRPFSVSFVDDKIETTLRFASFDAGGRVWNDLNIKFAYKIVSKDGKVVFQRESVDVVPGELEPNAPIPARFQAFRSIVMKRLENGILDEYVPEPILLDDPQTGEKRGSLVLVDASARDGWFEAKFDLRP